jgi:two-component system response regulator RegX3
MTRVLLVEDEPDLAEPLAYLLRREGYEVEIAEDGPTAVAAFEERGCDIVLLDLMLPGMSGTEVCRRIRQTSAVPIVMVTAKDSEVDIVVGLELGADDYVTKPFGMRELSARIRALLRRGHDRSGAPRRLDCGELQVDLDCRTVLRGGAALDLTHTEFELLAALAARPGQVFTRQQLLEQVWGYHFEGYERTVDSHITRLRKKLEPDPDEPRLIVTVRGVGYKFQR